MLSNLFFATLWSPAGKGLTCDVIAFLSLSHVAYRVRCRTGFYYIPINGTTLELSLFWPSDTESRINELRFSESISLPFKTRQTSATCFCGDVT